MIFYLWCCFVHMNAVCSEWRIAFVEREFEATARHGTRGLQWERGYGP